MPLEHAILAFLEFKPMSGYDLKKFFDVSVAHFWSSTQSHIYKALEGLEKKGWAQAQVIPQEENPTGKSIRLPTKGEANCAAGWSLPCRLTPSAKRVSSKSSFPISAQTKKLLRSWKPA